MKTVPAVNGKKKFFDDNGVDRLKIQKKAVLMIFQARPTVVHLVLVLFIARRRETDVKSDCIPHKNV